MDIIVTKTQKAAHCRTVSHFHHALISTQKSVEPALASSTIRGLRIAHCIRTGNAKPTLNIKLSRAIKSKRSCAYIRTKRAQDRH